jgi:hypothetical protein
VASAFEVYLGALHIQYHYEHGYTYLDRSGQTLVEIETECEGWTVEDISIHSGRMVDSLRRRSIVFDPRSFTYSDQKPTQPENSIASANHLWKIVQRNLGLDDLVRVGIRAQFFKPVHSPEDGERILAAAQFNIHSPPSLEKAGYKMAIRHPLAVFRRPPLEFRVELNTVRRFQGMASPTEILTSESRRLTKPRQAIQAKLLEEKQQYSRNPTHAVQLDVDCSQYALPSPSTAFLRDFALDTLKTCKADFLPLLGVS